MHEVFLQRLASHPTFKHDHGFRVFLEFEEELNVRNKTRKEKVFSFFTTYLSNIIHITMDLKYICYLRMFNVGDIVRSLSLGGLIVKFLLSYRTTSLACTSN